MDTLFFIASKVLGALVRSEVWLMLGIALALLGLWAGRRRLAGWAAAITWVWIVALSWLPLGHILLAPIERAVPSAPLPSQIDGIVVLGGAEAAGIAAYWDQVQFNGGGERFTAALALANRFPDAKVMFTGGSGALRDLGEIDHSEAAMAGRFFREQGLDPNRMLLEGASRNTAENAAFGLTLAAPAPDETWVLVTSAFHMPRALRSFHTAGWPEMLPHTVDYRTARFAGGIGLNLPAHMGELNLALKEWVGWAVYGVTGR